MIEKEQKDLACWAMDQCVKRGCQGVRISLYNGTNTEFEIRNTQVDKLLQSSENQLVLNLFKENRFGTFSTNRMDKKELSRFMDRAIDSIGFLAPDVCRQLPNPDRYFKGQQSDLNVYDADIVRMSSDEKMQAAFAVSEEILDTDARILSVQSSYSDGESFKYSVTNNGFEGETTHSYFSLTAQVSVQGEDGAKPEAFWYDQALFWKKLERTGIGSTALKKALERIGQKPAPSGTYPMIVDNMSIGRLLAPVLNALNGGALQQKNSFLLDKIGTQIFSNLVTIVDRPHIQGGFGARYFDNEGVATKNRSIIEQGVLQTYFIDTYNGLKMGVEPTISSPSQLIFDHGKQSMAQMVQSLEKGILVTGFNGGNCNSSSGDFSFGVEGFLIENGICVQPISEMNITGNMLQLWSQVAEIGNDPKMNSAYQIPSVMFDGVGFSGI